VEAQACTDARSDHAVLDFLVTFFIKKKGKNNHLLLARKLKILTTPTARKTHMLYPKPI